MGFYTKQPDKTSGDGLSITEWNSLSTAVAGGLGLKLAINPKHVVGIGTTDPVANTKLTVEGHVNIGGKEDTKLTVRHVLGKSDQDENTDNLYLNYDTGKDVHVGTFNQRTSNLLVSGKIGIGTYNPSTKLEVSGNATINNVFIGDVGHNSDWAGFSHSKSTSVTGYGLLQNKGGTITLINKKSGGGHIGFRVDNGDKMVITDNGNVGIGNTNPSVKLEVSGEVKANRFIGDGSGLTNLSVGATGLNLATTSGSKVGIGTTSPGAPLSIGTAAGKEEDPDSAMHITNDCILFGGNNAGKEGNSAQISAGKHGANRLTIVGMSSGQDSHDRKIDFWAEGGFIVRAGNVGIGTENPSAKLEVSGNVTVNGQVNATKIKIGNTEIGEREIQILKQLANSNLQIKLVDQLHKQCLDSGDGDGRAATLWNEGDDRGNSNRQRWKIKLV